MRYNPTATTIVEVQDPITFPTCTPEVFDGVADAEVVVEEFPANPAVLDAVFVAAGVREEVDDVVVLGVGSELQLPRSMILVNVKTVPCGPKFTRVRSLRLAKSKGWPTRFLAKLERGIFNVCWVPSGVK